MNLLLSLLLVAVGLFMLLKPTAIYQITESWKHDGPTEPSSFYLLNIRMGGGLCVAVGLMGSWCGCFFRKAKAGCPSGLCPAFY